MPGRRSVAQPFAHVRPTVGKFPRRFRAQLQLLDAHLQRLKHDMLTVVLFPVASEDSPLPLQSPMQFSAGKRCHHGEPGQIDARVYGETRGLEKYLRSILVEAEYETALQGDVAFVQASNYLRIFFRVVE